MKKVNVNMPWSQRLAIIEHFSPTDREVCEAFNVTQHELETAKQMSKSGLIPTAVNFDPVRYSSFFSNEESIKNPKESKAPTTFTPPQTATKKIREPKQRGRKGSKIQTAFGNIPSTPIDAETFATEHGVSVAVLRQSKRFNKESSTTVHVRKNKETGQLMIWQS